MNPSKPISTVSLGFRTLLPTQYFMFGFNFSAAPTDDKPPIQGRHIQRLNLFLIVTASPTSPTLNTPLLNPPDAPDIDLEEDNVPAQKSIPIPELTQTDETNRGKHWRN